MKTRTPLVSWLGLVLRFILAGVLGVAGALKVSDSAAAVAAVRAYQLLPESAERVVGYGLPFLEIALALLLLTLRAPLAIFRSSCAMPPGSSLGHTSSYIREARCRSTARSRQDPS